MQELSPLSGAKWIGAHRACQSPVITRRFFIADVKTAILFVTGLGYFEARINGKAVTEDRFLPLVTDYEPRDLSKFLYPLHDTLTHRVYFCRFDVTELLREGENTGAQGLFRPRIMSRRIIDAAMEEVMPHLLKPVAT